MFSSKWSNMLTGAHTFRWVLGIGKAMHCMLLLCLMQGICCCALLPMCLYPPHLLPMEQESLVFMSRFMQDVSYSDILKAGMGGGAGYGRRGRAPWIPLTSGRCTKTCMTGRPFPAWSMANAGAIWGCVVPWGEQGACRPHTFNCVHIRNHMQAVRIPGGMEKARAVSADIWRNNVSFRQVGIRHSRHLFLKEIPGSC